MIILKILLIGFGFYLLLLATYVNIMKKEEKKIRDKYWDSIILILSAHYEMEFIAYKSKILLLLSFKLKYTISALVLYKKLITSLNSFV